ncbi:hypothetical protein OsI_24618 [Oryza sativa Indica Group]|uniref:Uncharacterized protein n=1 Tax=Oryza sativa subsp. indica TaxID=39946 RepID=B8B6L0_ORYSI|nr:hypothetical protein OsI_24618 [Oryza sativa Indica Group]
MTYSPDPAVGGGFLLLLDARRRRLVTVIVRRALVLGREQRRREDEDDGVPPAAARTFGINMDQGRHFKLGRQQWEGMLTGMKICLGCLAAELDTTHIYKGSSVAHASVDPTKSLHGSNISAPTVLQFGKTGKLSVERADPRK